MTAGMNAEEANGPAELPAPRAPVAVPQQGVQASPLPAAKSHPASTPTRISGSWVGVVLGALVLALLLVFVLQNTKPVRVSFFTASGHLPLGVALLFAAVGGVLLTATVASLRLLQIRRRLARSSWRAGSLASSGTGAQAAEQSGPVANRYDAPDGVPPRAEDPTLG
jgi:lipopolysaccharide assembly protein A